MDKAIELKAAIETVVKARMESTNVTAIWNKLDRIAAYLNNQLATELTNW